MASQPIAEAVALEGAVRVWLNLPRITITLRSSGLAAYLRAFNLTS